MNSNYNTQNGLLMNNLTDFYRANDNDNMNKILPIINGESLLSIRIIDWFVTNYAKKNYTVYKFTDDNTGREKRFKVYTDYKLKLKAYSKKRFDPFCRWERIIIPYNDESNLQTTIGQLNFFKWALENKIIDYILENMKDIENDMNSRNSNSRKKQKSIGRNGTQTNKKREELSVSAIKSVKKEEVEIVVKFD